MNTLRLLLVVGVALSCEIDAGGLLGPSLLITGPSHARNGDRLALLVDLRVSGADISADFSQLDSAYDEGRATVLEQAGGRYEIAYVISEQNMRPDGRYLVRLRARLGGEEGLQITETYPMTLANTIPRAGTVSAVSGSARVSAAAGDVPLLSFDISANAQLFFAGVELELKDATPETIGVIEKVSLYHDVDSNRKISTADVLLSESSPAGDESGRFNVLLAVKGKDGAGPPSETARAGKIPLSQGRNSFLIAVSTNCLSGTLAGRSLTLELDSKGLLLTGPKNEPPDLSGLPLTAKVSGARPFERLWTTDLGLFPSGRKIGVSTDLNSDGKEELLLLADKDSRYLWILSSPRLTGFITAQPRMDLGVNSVSSVLFADVDVDGVSDVILSSPSLRGVRTVLSSIPGRDGQAFSIADQAIRNTPGPLLLPGEAARVNGDQIMDLVALDQKTGTLIVASGKLDPGKSFILSPIKEVRTGLSGIVGFDVLDFDGDSVSDVVLATTSLTEGVLYSYGAPNKDGNYQLVSREGGLPPISLMRAADIDGDGTPEVVVLSKESGELRLYRVEAEGIFTLASVEKGLNGARDLADRAGLAVSDLDGNGIADFVILENNGADIRVLLMNASLRSSKNEVTRVSKVTGEVLTSLDGLVIAGLAGSAAREIVGLSSERIAVMKQTRGTLSLAFATDPQPLPTSVGLLSDAGKATRLAVTDASNSKIYVYGLGEVGNLEGIIDRVTTVSAGFGATSAAFTGATQEDLAVLLSGGAIGIFRGDTYQVASTLTTGTGGRGLLSMDIDGDGRLDLAHSNPSAGTVSWFLAGTGGAFTSRSVTTLPDPEGQVFVDVTGDGYRDIVSIHPVSGSISVATGDPTSGAYSRPASIALGGVPQTIAEGDTDGDGIPEVIVGVRDGAILFYQPQPGSPFLRLVRSLKPAVSITSLAVVDADGDRNPDLLGLVKGGPGRDGLDGLMFIGTRGDGRYCAPSFEDIPSGAVDFKVGELDGDGNAADVVIVGASDRAIEAFRNTLKDTQ